MEDKGKSQTPDAHKEKAYNQNKMGHPKSKSARRPKRKVHTELPLRMKKSSAISLCEAKK